MITFVLVSGFDVDDLAVGGRAHTFAMAASSSLAARILLGRRPRFKLYTAFASDFL